MKADLVVHINQLISIHLFTKKNAFPCSHGVFAVNRRKINVELTQLFTTQLLTILGLIVLLNHRKQVRANMHRVGVSIEQTRRHLWVHFFDVFDKGHDSTNYSSRHGQHI